MLPAIDALALEGFSNRAAFTRALDERVASALRERLEGALRGWVSVFPPDSPPQQPREQQRQVRGGAPDADAAADDDDESRAEKPDAELRVFAPALKHSVHELRLRSRSLLVEPPLEAASVSLSAQLAAHLGAVLAGGNSTRLGRPKATLPLADGRTMIEAVVAAMRAV